jgi:hypothetical protein
MPSFSERRGHSQPKEIEFRDELPVKLRMPIFDILRKSVGTQFIWERMNVLFNPYGIDEWPPAWDRMEKLIPWGTDDWPEKAELVARLRSTSPSQQKQDSDLNALRVFLSCQWFQVYDLIEDVFGQLDFYDSELKTDPEEEARAFPLQRDINNFFTHAGIGWQLVKGEIVTRGDQAFESTVSNAVAVLESAKKPTAAGHLRFALAALSGRPKPDTGGAVAHGTSAVECVLGDITGEAMTLGEYLNKNRRLFPPALKKGLDGIYGYASEEGARHGKEGTEPTREEAEFVVAVCAAVCTLLTRKHPKE